VTIKHELEAEQFTELCNLTEGLTRAVRLIAEGERSPAGLEGLGMAIAGEGLSSPLSAAVTSGFERLAEAIETAGNAIADAIDRSKETE
jgi:hypothetical protein